MPSIACNTLTRDLIKPEDMFARLDPQRVTQEIEGPLLQMLEDIVREIASTCELGFGSRCRKWCGGN